MEQLSDLTRQIERNRALTKTGDRLLQIALHGGPAMSKSVVAGIGPADLPFANDPDATVLLQPVARRSVPGQLLANGAIGVPARQLLPVSDDDDLAPTWVDAGAPVPMARLTSTSASCDSTHYMMLLAFHREVLVAGDARARNYIVSRSVRALTRGDNTIIDATAASAARPAGLLNGRDPIGTGSPGQLGDDVAEAVAYVSDGAPIAPVWIASPRGAVFLNATGLHLFRNVGLRGGEIAGAPVIIAPDAMNRLVLVDAGHIAIADEGLEIAQSRQAAVEMLDNPTNNAASGTATNMVSLFQANAIALRYTRYLSWRALRDDAVGYVELAEIGGSPA